LNNCLGQIFEATRSLALDVGDSAVITGYTDLTLTSASPLVRIDGNRIEALAPGVATIEVGRGPDQRSICVNGRQRCPGLVLAIR